MDAILSSKDQSRESAVCGERDEVRKLLQMYLDVLGDSEAEPAISIMGFVRLIKGYIIWALYLEFATPVLGVINLFIFLLNRFVGSKISYRGHSVLSVVGQPFRSLHNGEISALKFLTLGYVTKLFVSYHIQRRLDRLESALKTIELRELLRAKDDGSEPAICKSFELLAKFRDNLSSQVKLKFLLLFTPYLPALIKLAVPEDRKTLISHLATWSRGRSGELLVFYSITLCTYALWVFVSSFIRKRELMNNRGVYAEETQLFQLLNGTRPREFPLDLVGWLTVIVLGTIPNWFYLYFQSSQHPQFHLSIVNCGQFVLIIVPFVYALYRRSRVGNW